MNFKNSILLLMIMATCQIMPSSVTDLFKKGKGPAVGGPLRRLNLSGKSLTTLQGLDTIKNISRARIINLADNKFTTIPAGALSVAENVSILNLAGNKLTAEGLQGIAGLKNLRALILNSNNISDIPSEILDTLPKLTFVAVYNNPISDEKIAALRKRGLYVSTLPITRANLKKAGVATATLIALILASVATYKVYQGGKVRPEWSRSEKEGQESSFSRGLELDASGELRPVLTPIDQAAIESRSQSRSLRERLGDLVLIDPYLSFINTNIDNLENVRGGSESQKTAAIDSLRDLVRGALPFPAATPAREAIDGFCEQWRGKELTTSELKEKIDAQIGQSKKRLEVGIKDTFANLKELQEKYPGVEEIEQSYQDAARNMEEKSKYFSQELNEPESHYEPRPVFPSSKSGPVVPFTESHGPVQQGSLPRSLLESNKPESYEASPVFQLSESDRKHLEEQTKLLARAHLSLVKIKMDDVRRMGEGFPLLEDKGQALERQGWDNDQLKEDISWILRSKFNNPQGAQEALKEGKMGTFAAIISNAYNQEKNGLVKEMEELVRRNPGNDEIAQAFQQVQDLLKKQPEITVLSLEEGAAEDLKMEKFKIDIAQGMTDSDLLQEKLDDLSRMPKSLDFFHRVIRRLEKITPEDSEQKRAEEIDSLKKEVRNRPYLSDITRNAIDGFCEQWRGGELTTSELKEKIDRQIWQSMNQLGKDIENIFEKLKKLKEMYPGTDAERLYRKAEGGLERHKDNMAQLNPGFRQD